MALTLVIGNKNYSSWSFRPWIAMKTTGIAFDETVIPIREPGEFKTATRRKLLLEISGLETPARVFRTQVTETMDCSVGERQWRRYLDGTPN